MFRRTQDPLRRERSFDYRAVTSYGGPFQTSSSTSFLCNSVQSVLQPQEASLLVWANPVSLAATQGIAFAFSSSGYLDVSVPRVRFKTPMYSGLRYLSHPTIDIRWITIAECQVGFPIRTSMDQSPFPAPHGLTQGITSFIASCCLGIHQTPFSRLI